jgi:hypothetical protein
MCMNEDAAPKFHQTIHKYEKYWSQLNGIIQNVKLLKLIILLLQYVCKTQTYLSIKKSAKRGIGTANHNLSRSNLMCIT